MNVAGDERKFAEYGISDEEMVTALAEQEAYIRKLLNGRRQGDAEQELMGQVALETITSLPSWERCGEPKLGAWARGVARNAFLTWTRSPSAGQGPGKTSLESIDALAETKGVEIVALAQPEADERTQARVLLIQRLKEVILAGPNGAVVMRELFTPDWEVRGRTAHARIMQLLEVVVDPDGSLRHAAGVGPDRDHFHGAA